MKKTDAEAQAEEARKAIRNRKGLHPVVLDVRGLSGVADFFVIAAGGSPPHLKTLAAEVTKRWRETEQRRVRKTGAVESGWIVIDGLDVVVHLLSPELRERYALESLWSDALRVADEDADVPAE